MFLDRDGVINRSFVKDGKTYPPYSLKELQILPGVRSALIMLRSAGYLNIVVTNQPDISTGKQSLKVVEAMHSQLSETLAIDHFEVCKHVNEDQCDCRKPKPGMLLRAATRFSIDLSQSYMIGDRWLDVEAGQRAGCRRTYFIDYGYAERIPIMPFYQVDSLSSAARSILAES